MSGNWTWEQCVREVSCTVRPDICGELAAQWHGVSSGVEELARKLTGQGAEPPAGETGRNGQSLTAVVAAWSGAGGAAYREQLGELGAACRRLAEEAAELSAVYRRMESYLTAATEGIPVPVRTSDCGFRSTQLMRLPGGTWINPGRMDDATLRASLKADYVKSSGSYADGAFAKLADELKATLRKSGGYWSRSEAASANSDLAAWYSTCSSSAVGAVSVLSKAVVDESPSFQITETTSPAPAGDLGSAAVDGAEVRIESRSGLAGAGGAVGGIAGAGGFSGVGGVGLVDGSLGAGAASVPAVGGIPGLVSPGGPGAMPITAPAAVVQSAARPNTGAMLGCMGGMGAMDDTGGSGGSGGDQDWLYETELWRVDQEAAPAVIDSRSRGPAGPRGRTA